MSHNYDVDCELPQVYMMIVLSDIFAGKCVKNVTSTILAFKILIDIDLIRDLKLPLQRTKHAITGDFDQPTLGDCKVPERPSWKLQRIYSSCYHLLTIAI